MAKVYQLTDGELAIIQQAREQNNPNIFLDWFLKGPNTGTYYKPNAKTELWRSRWRRLHETWAKKGKPEVFVKETEGGDERVYKALFGRKDGGQPTFFFHHGFRLQPWQLEAYTAEQRIRAIIGGYGCGKTIGQVAYQLYQAATIPGYRVIFGAPTDNQVKEAYKGAMNLMAGTLYWEKFLVGRTLKAPATFTIGNSLVGEMNTIECYSFGDGADKIETFNLWEAVVDQAEKFEDMEELIRVIGSRFRGQIQGQEIEGHMTFLANAKDNEALWDLYESAEEDPDRVYAASPSTYDNIYITDDQLGEIEKDVGGTEETIRVHMKGGKPLGNGEHFPSHVMAKVRNETLEGMMADGLAKKLPGFVERKVGKIGVVQWELPYIEGHSYFTIFDPGWSNPPARNSAVGMVWDHTDFPNRPATLAAFSWVYGNNSPEPWIAMHEYFIDKYHCRLTSGIDATGWQSGYMESMWAFGNQAVTGIKLHVNQKARYLTFAKRLSEKGMMQMPYIQGAFSQLTRYKLPETQKAKTDIVSCYIMSAGWLEPALYYQDREQTPQDKIKEWYEDRWESAGSGESMDTFLPEQW